MENDSQKLGEIERPAVDRFERGRKLFFVPLVFYPPRPEEELTAIVDRYWDQVESQLANLETKLGQAVKLYHELVPAGGQDGVKAIEELNLGSYQVVKARVDGGAALQPLEDGQLLSEFMDWSKCLAAGLQSEKAVRLVYEAYNEGQKQRNEHMAKQLDETLEEEEVGVLFMVEGHRVQFPSSIQVFYVAPPALDEMKRWLRSRAIEGENKIEEQPAN